MKIDVYTATGTKKGSQDLPASIFEAPMNEGLMHQAVVRQQGNRRHAIAHVKSRGEVQGSTRKMFAQKGTGRARRGSIRAPLLRGGGKAFGPRNKASFSRDMPRKMRRAALLSCLSLQAKNGKILGLEGYPNEVKTKSFATLLGKMPVDVGRSILIVLSAGHIELQLSARNIPGVKTVQASYLSPEDVLNAHHMVFMVDAIQKVEDIWGGETSVKSKKEATKKSAEDTKGEDAAKVKEKKVAAPKKTPTKKTSTPKA